MTSRALAMAKVSAAALLCAALFGAALPASAAAQSSGETERKLANVKRELHQVAAERRKLEGERGDASRRLREADEKVGKSNRSLRETETRLTRDRYALAELQAKRDELNAGLSERRAQLARLLRAAYAQGEAGALKALLAQDSLAEANRLLTYQRYVQADRARRILTLNAQLREVDTVEAAIRARQDTLAQARVQQRQQLGQLELDRKQRAALVARLEAQYSDRREREQALGRDAQGLERVLKQLRAAAARADAQRRAAAAKAARDGKRMSGGTRAAVRPPVLASAAPLQVGGAGWPLTGALLAGFGGTMPDGRESAGLLIAAKAGAPVKAVADGNVVYAEWMTGYGLLLIVDHGNGYLSLYAHNDALLKDVGTRVKRGEAVATVGSSGGHGRPALYFELRRNGQPVNPSAWLHQ